MKIKVKLNLNMHGFKKGEIIDIAVDKKGIPLVREWRNRLKDSLIDNCLELLENTNKAKSDGKKK